MTVFGFLLFLPAIALYFLPSIIAHNKTNFGGVFVLNLLLGWTLVGWIIALIWALGGDSQRVVLMHQGSGVRRRQFLPPVRVCAGRPRAVLLRLRKRALVIGQQQRLRRRVSVRQRK